MDDRQRRRLADCLAAGDVCGAAAVLGHLHVLGGRQWTRFTIMMPDAARAQAVRRPWKRSSTTNGQPCQRGGGRIREAIDE